MLISISERYQQKLSGPHEDSAVYKVYYDSADNDTEKYGSYADYVSASHNLVTIPLDTWELLAAPQVKIRIRHEGAYGLLSMDELLSIIFSVPDIRCFKIITILDFSHRDEKWYQREAKLPDLRIETEREDNEGIIWYRPSDYEGAVAGLLQGYMGLIKIEMPKEFAAFKTISENEKVFIPFRTTPSDTPAEQLWCQLGALIIGPDLSRACSVAHMNPLLVLPIIACLVKLVSGVPSDLRSSRHDGFLKVVEFCKQEVIPLAEQNLIEQDKHSIKAAEAKSLLQCLANARLPQSAL